MTYSYSTPGLGVTSAIGRAVRLRRLLGSDGRGVFIALDQAIPRGVHPRLANIGETFQAISKGAPNAITMTRGIGARFVPQLPHDQPWILKASVFSLEFHKTRDAVIGSVQDAIRLGADAVSIGISLGSEDQVTMLEILSRFVEEASQVGLPTICHAYPSGDLWGDKARSPEAILYSARAAAEVGVDIVKTWYTGSPETFRDVVTGTPALVMTSGGVKANSPLEVLEMAEGVITAGGAGITFGRNVWDSVDPERMVRALNAVVHDGVAASDAARLVTA